MSFLNIQNKYTNVIMYSLLVKHYHIKLTSLVIYVCYRYIDLKYKKLLLKVLILKGVSLAKLRY